MLSALIAGAHIRTIPKANAAWVRSFLERFFIIGIRLLLAAYCFGILRSLDTVTQRTLFLIFVEATFAVGGFKIFGQAERRSFGASHKPVL